MIIMKFGGTSLGSSSKIKEAANIVKSYLDSEPAIIVSAIGGITDMVIGAVEAASKGKVDLGDIRKKHEGIIGDLGLDSKILDDLDALEELLTSVKDVQINTKDMDSALSFGERLSSKIFAAYLEKEGVDEDIVLEKSLELGADDFESENDVIEITTSQEAFGDVSNGLEKEGFEIAGEVGLTPVNSVNVTGNDAKQLLLLLEKLEDHEDIQKVYSNFDLDECEMESLL